MEKINRKAFFKKSILLGFTTVSIPALIESCGKKNNNEPASDPCTDTSSLSPDDLQTRKTFQYLGSSPNKDKFCSICNFYIKPQDDAHCGTCQIVKGPINPGGYCNSFIKKQTEA